MVVKLKIWQKRLIQTILILSAFPADWSCIAVLAILGMYEKRGNLEKQMLKMIPWVTVYGIVSYFFVSKVYALELVGVLMVYPVLKLYNGERGRAKWMKWFFYVVHPHKNKKPSKRPPCRGPPHPQLPKYPKSIIHEMEIYVN